MYKCSHSFKENSHKSNREEEELRNKVIKRQDSNMTMKI